MNICYLNEIVEKARRHIGRRLIKRDLHQLSHLRRPLRQQNAHRLLDTLHLKHSLLHILLLGANPGAAKHQLLNPLPILRGHAVGHEPAVADPGHEHSPPDAVGLHQAHDALRLERLGAFWPGRVGVAEEDEVGDVEVEAGGEWGDELVPLPHCVGADAMDEEEGGFGW